MNDFAGLLQKLAGKVKFIIIGGVAATIHGASRLTQDIDIVYSRSVKNLVSLAEALAPLILTHAVCLPDCRSDGIKRQLPKV